MKKSELIHQIDETIHSSISKQEIAKVIEMALQLGMQPTLLREECYEMDDFYYTIKVYEWEEE